VRLWAVEIRAHSARTFSTPRNKNCLNNGVSLEEIRAIIHVIGIYCGVPQALECFRVARKVLQDAGKL